MHYYREVEAIWKDDTRRDELPVAKARYRAVEDLYQEMRRALADALGAQKRRDGVNVAELHALALEASDTKSTGRKVRHARDELVRVCLSLGGES